MRGRDRGQHWRRRAMAAGILTLSFLSLGVAHAAAADLLPDLGMARLANLTVEKTSGGRELLRYTTVITNTGAGPFELHGHRSSTIEPEMSVEQKIYNDAGGSRTVPTNAKMYYAGDGHNHWHVRDLESGELIRLDNGSKVGTSAKHGFCFSDNVEYRLTLAGAPQLPMYTDCGHESDLKVTVGLSVGWGDKYNYTVAFQYIDITGISPGRYRLQGTADPANWFAESNTSNNTTCVDLQLKGRRHITILGYGPSA
jgi:hypothetical protein